MNTHAVTKQDAESTLREAVREALLGDILPYLTNCLVKVFEDHGFFDNESTADEAARRRRLREELEKQMRSRIFQDLKNREAEIRNEIASDLRTEIREELEAEIKEQVREDHEDELRKSVTIELREELRTELLPEVKRELRAELIAKLVDASPKCERFSKLLPDVGTIEAHPTLCGRCAEAVG